MRRFGDGRRRRLLGLLALALLVVLAGCSFDPPDVCASCTAVDRNDEGLDVTTDHARMTVEVGQDGSAHVTSEADLVGTDLGRLRSDPALTERLVWEALASDGVTDPDDVENLSTTFSGDTLVVEYDAPSFANSYPGGVVVVDGFNRQPTSSRLGWELGADRVRVVGPDGSVVANRPPDGEVEERSVTYRRSVDPTTYVAFASGGSLPSRVAADVALGVEVAKWAAPLTLVASLFPAAWFGALASLSLSRTREAPPTRSTDWEDLRWGVAVGLLFVPLVLGIGTLPGSTLESGGVFLVWLLAPTALFWWLGTVTEASWGRELAVLVGVVGTSIAAAWSFVAVSGDSAPTLLAILTVLATIPAAIAHSLARRFGRNAS